MDQSKPLPKLTLAQQKTTLAQRTAEREDRSKPLCTGVHLIHRPTGFGYVVDGHAEAFDEPSVQLVILSLLLDCSRRLKWSSQ